MARRHTKTRDASQYALDFESQRNERYALLMSAVEVVGLGNFKELARLIFNDNERGEPCDRTIGNLATLVGRSTNTVRRWRDDLAAIGLVEVEQRTRVRGGARSSRITINWLNVRTFAVDRVSATPAMSATPAQPLTITPEKLDSLDHPPKFGGRAPILGGRAPILGAPIKEYPSPYSHNPLPPPLRATTCAVATTCDTTEASEEEEIFLRQLSAACREQLKRQTPRRLDPALRQALANGLTHEQLRERCRWFVRHQFDWKAEGDQRAGAFYIGLVEAMPYTPPDQGWPYQR